MRVEDLRPRQHVESSEALLARQLARQAERRQDARRERLRFWFEVSCVMAALFGLLAIIAAAW
jgi:hypothetical protein